MVNTPLVLDIGRKTCLEKHLNKLVSTLLCSCTVNSIAELGQFRNWFNPFSCCFMFFRGFFGQQVGHRLAKAIPGETESSFSHSINRSCKGKRSCVSSHLVVMSLGYAMRHCSKKWMRPKIEVHMVALDKNHDSEREACTGRCSDNIVDVSVAPGKKEVQGQCRVMKSFCRCRIEKADFDRLRTQIPCLRCGCAGAGAKAEHR